MSGLKPEGINYLETVLNCDEENSTNPRDIAFARAKLVDDVRIYIKKLFENGDNILAAQVCRELRAHNEKVFRDEPGADKALIKHFRKLILN